MKLCLVLLLGPVLGAFGQDVSFYREAMAVFSKSGCNMGACHGNANGKGGLKLSLRGENPAADAKAIKESKSSRLIRRDAPGESFLLKKPAKLVSHEGGKRFEVGSPEYAVLEKWIAQGMPVDLTTTPALVELVVSPTDEVLIGAERETRITVKARHADGSEHDVTRWAVYEPSNLVVEASADGVIRARQDGETTVTVRYLHLQKPVRLAFVPDRKEFVWDQPAVHNFIDDAVFAKLQRLHINQSAICEDSVFLRRVYLDVLGILPTEVEARAFLADARPTQEKRTSLVDGLLQRPEYGQQWALRWSDLLRNEEKVVDVRGVALLWRWIRDSFNEDKPLDQFSRELVSGFGSTYENPPANFLRALRDPASRAEATAQVFLGVRLQCAKCHNHPFERWTQDDYYRFSALFDGVDYHVLRNGRGDKFDKHEYRGEQVVHMQGKRDFKDPRTKKLPKPGMLGSEAPAVQNDPERFTEMAQWLTAKDQPLFARVQANRIWYHLIGIGIVDPVDDFRATNPPSNPVLLEALAAEFLKNGFRVKPLVRSILLSRTYQASAVPNATNREEGANFARVLPRRFTAEQVLDAVQSVLQVSSEFRGQPDGLRAGELPGVRGGGRKEGGPTDDDRFLQCFGKPARLISSEMERSNSTSLSQVFLLTSGPRMHQMLRKESNFLTTLQKESDGNGFQLMERAFLAALGRFPISAEKSALETAAGPIASDRTALEDFIWSLLNSKEFLMRQ